MCCSIAIILFAMFEKKMSRLYLPYVCNCRSCTRTVWRLRLSITTAMSSQPDRFDWFDATWRQLTARRWSPQWPDVFKFIRLPRPCQLQRSIACAVWLVHVLAIGRYVTRANITQHHKSALCQNPRLPAPAYCLMNIYDGRIVYRTHWMNARESGKPPTSPWWINMTKIVEHCSDHGSDRLYIPAL